MDETLENQIISGIARLDEHVKLMDSSNVESHNRIEKSIENLVNHVNHCNDAQDIIINQSREDIKKLKEEELKRKTQAAYRKKLVAGAVGTLGVIATVLGIASYFA